MVTSANVLFFSKTENSSLSAGITNQKALISWKRYVPGTVMMEKSPKGCLQSTDSKMQVQPSSQHRMQKQAAALFFMQDWVVTLSHCPVQTPPVFNDAEKQSEDAVVTSMLRCKD